MISGAEWSAIEPEAKEAGVDKFVSKPLFPSMIVDIVSECLGVNPEQAEDALPNNDGIFEGHCVLLVEDVEINREVLLALLEPTRLNIECAENGAEAVRTFGEAPSTGTG